MWIIYVLPHEGIHQVPVFQDLIINKEFYITHAIIFNIIA